MRQLVLPPSRCVSVRCAAAATMLVVLVTVYATSGAADPEPATASSTRPVRPETHPGAIAARRVVFVCDASGSMKPKLPTLRRQLHNVVRDFAQSQEFNIIFCHDDDAPALSRDALVRADAAGKRAADRFIDDAETTTTSEPTGALRLAFRQNPELIFLLTDGDFPDNKSVLELVRKLNPHGTVKVNTIAFTNEKDPDTEFLQLLEKIAKENGGLFKHVDVADLKD